MTQRLETQLVAEKAIIHAEVPFRAAVDTTFELPPVLYGAMAALFMGFIGVLGMGMATPGLIVPMAVIVLFIVAFFTVPALWTRLGSGARAMTLRALQSEGMATLTGRITARQAIVQMLLLPVLIFAWAVAWVTLAALL